MKIWLDAKMVYTRRADDCEDDGPDDCSDHENYRIFGNSDGTSPGRLEAGLFQSVPALYQQELSDERLLVADPTGSGSIAILDTDAASFLQQFQAPLTFQQLSANMTVWSRQRLERGVLALQRAGLLHDHTQPFPERQLPPTTTLSAWLHITNACNLGCDYCYIQKSSEHMNDTVARQSVDAVFRSARLHALKRILLRYAGGEASLQVERVLQVHRYASEQARQEQMILRAYMISNGVFLSQAAIESFKEHKIGISLSIDGVGEDHDRQRAFVSGRGSFSAIERTLDRLSDSGLVPHILVTVSRRNLAGLPGLMEYLLQRQLPFSLSFYRENSYASAGLQFSEEQMISGLRAAFAVIEQQLPRHSLLNCLLDKASLSSPHSHTCGVGRNYLVIDQRGRVAKCQANMQQTITTIKANDPLQVIRSHQHGVRAVAVEEKEGCRDCTWRNWCTGGCPMLTYRVTGRNDVKSPNCAIYQALFPDILRLEALRLLTYTAPMTL